MKRARHEKPVTNDPTQLTTTPGTALGPHIEAPGREYQELWFTLARKQWSSLVLVPADHGGSAALIANSLVDVAKWLREQPPILFIMSDPLDYASATEIVSFGSQDQTERGAAPERVICAVQPVIVEPLGMSVAQHADAVVLCIEKGRSRMSSVRRTIELIGREKITGCVYIN